MRIVFSTHLAISLFFAVGFFAAVFNGLKERTAFRILLAIDDLLFMRMERQFKVAVIRSGSLYGSEKRCERIVMKILKGLHRFFVKYT